MLCRDIWKQSRSAAKNVKLDVHARLMRSYKEVPQWWFLILLLGSVIVSLLLSFVWKKDVQLPWWGMLLAFALAWVVTLPIGVIQATTNQVLQKTVKFSLETMPNKSKDFVDYSLIMCVFVATWNRHNCAVHNWVFTTRKTNCKLAFQDLRPNQLHSCSLFLIRP